MIIFHNISQLITLAGGPQRGLNLGKLSMIEQGAIACDGEVIVAVGREDEIFERFLLADRVDLRCRAVVPGFVDPHTHLIWAGDRANEFEMRLQGKSYMEIMAAGGGILATLTATRKASLEQLVEEARGRADVAFSHGTTTIEAKTGYGLDIETELRQLEAILELDRTAPIDLVPTYMGAHAIPPEYKGNTAGYTRFLCEEALPVTKQWWLEHANGRPLPFVDVFCEAGVFEIEETREILGVAKDLGFPLKLHVDEFENLGGASLAAELGAVSADHLVKTSLDDIARLAVSETVAVSLPGTPFGLAQREYTPAKEIVAANGYLALATDLNPGTTWNESMQFIQALACRYLKLTPAQALAASTINAAKAVALEHEVGSIEVGKQADFLVLTTPDYRNLSYRYGTNQVAMVVKNGELYPNAE
jgi:imidazolonepropionase